MDTIHWLAGRTMRLDLVSDPISWRLSNQRAADRLVVANFGSRFFRLPLRQKLSLKSSEFLPKILLGKPLSRPGHLLTRLRVVTFATQCTCIERLVRHATLVEHEMDMKRT